MGATKDSSFAPTIWELKSRNVFYVKKWKNLTLSFDNIHYVTLYFPLEI